MMFRLVMATIAMCSAWAAVGWTQQKAAVAPAAQRLQDLEQRFQQLDKNGDGRITTDEVPLSPFFQQRDLNGDGVITLAEAKAAMEGASPIASSPPAASAASGSTGGPSAAAAAKSPPLATTRPRSSTSWRQGPQPVPANQHGVGRLAADVAFKDLAGKAHRLGEFPDHRAVVVAMTSTSCPMSRKYLPTLAHLAATFADRPVAWIFVNSIPVDRPEDMRRSADYLGDGAIYVRDADGAIAKAVGALTTTDVIILDRSRTVLFHGAVDDQYGIGYSTDQPKRQYLADALEAILANKPPPIAATEAPGCALDLGDEPAPPTDVTFHNRVSRIMQANCVECHREGGVGPFSLVTYDDVAGHAGMIKQVLKLGTMPPWFAAPEEGVDDKAHSPWANDRSLSATDKADLLAWIDGGKQLGDARDAVQPHTYNTGWLIGTPDAIFEFPRAVPVKATGTMPYENVIVETNLDSDQWVQAIEVQPGDRSVVHHMLIYLLASDRDGVSLKEEAEDERNGFWAIYVPGNATLVYPDGFARLMPQGVKLRCQVHYAPSGMATTDRSRIGVVYAKQPPRHEVRVVGIGNPHMAIPPGAENHKEEGSLKLPMDIQILAFLPHMHLRSKACRYRVVSPSGETRTLLDIPRYDFDWQLLYRYRHPRRVLKGETIKFTGWFDNSQNNPANPDPTATVRWGKQINDEMHLGYVEYFVPGLAPGEPLPAGKPGR
jgi:hypothetical protein